MRYKRHKKIKHYKTVKQHECAIVFNNSEQLIEFICCIKNTNIINSSLYTQNGYYILLLLTDKSQNINTFVAFKDRLHIKEIKLNCRLICKCDAVYKMQKAFIKT